MRPCTRLDLLLPRGTPVPVARTLAPLLLVPLLVLLALSLTPSLGASLSAQGTVSSRTTTPATARADNPAAQALLAQAASAAGGIAAVVSDSTGTVWAGAVGHAGEHGNELTPATPLRAYSLLKQVTAALTLRLVEQGTLRPDATVASLAPELPQAWAAIGVMQLLQHRGGIRHYTTRAEAHRTIGCTSTLDALAPFRNDPLVAVPGAQEVYSTYGFVLLSHLLERAANTPFDALLRRAVFEPAGMDSSRIAPLAQVGWQRGPDGTRQPAPAAAPSCKWGGGGYEMSAVDLGRFHQAVLRGALVSLPTVRRMLAGREALRAGGEGVGGAGASELRLQGAGRSIVVLTSLGGPAGLEMANMVLDGLSAMDLQR